VNDPVNLGSGTGISIKTIVDIIVDKCEKDIQVKWDTTKPAGDRLRILDTTRAAGFGFEAQTPIEKGIQETISWFNINKASIDERFNAFKK
jgi:GDP-L-fucose synthase